MMAQLDRSVDAYMEVNESEGDGPPDTWDFLLATTVILQAAEDDDETVSAQAVIDAVTA